METVYTTYLTDPGLGRYLLGGVILTSAFHVFAVLGGVHLPSALHIAAALLQVVGMELSVWYLLASKGASKVAGIKSGWVAPAYYLGLNGVLNAAYFLASTAGLPLWASSVLPVVTALWVAALILYIPVAVSSLENARYKLGEARLVLLGDIARLEDELAELEAGTGTGGTGTGTAGAPLVTNQVTVAPTFNVDTRTAVLAGGTADGRGTAEGHGTAEGRDQAVLAGLLEEGTAEVLEVAKKGASGTGTDRAHKLASEYPDRRARIEVLLDQGYRSKSAIFREVGGNRARTFALIGEVAQEMGVTL